jgi:hypothetical protein
MPPAFLWALYQAFSEHRRLNHPAENRKAWPYSSN